MNLNAIIALLELKGIISREEGEKLVEYINNKPQSTLLADAVEQVKELVEPVAAKIEAAAKSVEKAAAKAVKAAKEEAAKVATDVAQQVAADAAAEGDSAPQK